MKIQIIELLNKGLSYSKISKELGCSKSTIAYHAKRLGKPYHIKANKRYNWAEVKTYYDVGNTYAQCVIKFGFSAKTWNKAVKAGKVIPRSQLIPLEEQLVENCKSSRGGIKRKLIQQGLLPNKCAECGQLPVWNNKPLVMVLDHINGVSDDYRLDNLRLLCSNCNSQTETFAGRNNRRK